VSTETESRKVDLGGKEWEILELRGERVKGEKRSRRWNGGGLGMGMRGRGGGVGKRRG